jgi:squalene-hopene/tetraprenyl-beta-curcumene cyclase
MFRRLVIVSVSAFCLTSLSAAADGWNPGRAARYLDGRLEQWFAWKTAASPDGPCVSCHTGMTYLLARPALRRRLGEAQPTQYEQGLLGRLRAHVGAKPEGYLQGVESIFAALFLSSRDAGTPMSADTARAFDQLWTLQRREGASAGNWDWLIVNLDPWEQSESPYFGAALAAIAVSNAGSSYAGRPEVRDAVARLATYLRKPAPANRPLHDRVALLWAASSWSPLLTSPERDSLIADVFHAQASDGGWTNASLGPWAAHADAPPASGTNSYATGFVTYVLLRAGIPSSDPRLARALGWLADHQDRDTGAWHGVSMNKRYPEGSMESLFMQDAATAFASMALIEAGR